MMNKNEFKKMYGEARWANSLLLEESKVNAILAIEAYDLGIEWSMSRASEKWSGNDYCRSNSGLCTYGDMLAAKLESFGYVPNLIAIKFVLSKAHSRDFLSLKEKKNNTMT